MALEGWIATLVAIAAGAGGWYWVKDRFPQGKRAWPMAGVILGALVLSALANQWLLGLAGKDEFSGTVDSYNAVDEANLRVVLEIKNDGTGSAKAKCVVQAFDASGRIIGSDILSTTEDITGGDTYRASGVIRIEENGAHRVRSVTARNCSHTD